MKYKVGDIYEENKVYFIVTELKDNVLTISIPLSRYILINYISTTEEALEVFKETIFKFETSKLLKSI